MKFLRLSFLLPFALIALGCPAPSVEDAGPNPAPSDAGVQDAGPANTCNDGELQTDEECEGFELRGQTCSTQGYENGALTCSNSCELDTLLKCSTCGDEQATGTEACDTNDFLAETCESLGFGPGELFCTDSCTFDVSGCTACSDGTWDDDSDPATPCVPHTNCVASEFVSTQGTSTNDRLCTPCEGSFSTEENAEACTPWKVCALETLTGGTFTSDFECGAQPIQVLPSENYTCAVFDNGTVRCWGENGEDSNFGNNSTLDSVIPVEVPGLTTVRSIKNPGYGRMYGELENGSIVVWPAYEQVDGGWESLMAPGPFLEELSDLQFFSVGAAYFCVKQQDGNVQCLGSNSHGQTGGGTISDWVTDFTNIPEVENAHELYLAWSSSYALMPDRSLKSWGNNDVGQLGLGDEEDRSSPVTVPGLENIVSIHATGIETILVAPSHACVALSDGSVKCWGANNYGQLGDGTQVPSNIPVTVAGIDNAVSVHLGWIHSCAILADGNVKCWGANSNGILGISNDDPQLLPATIPGLENVTSLSLNRTHLCAIQANDEVKCWGGNSYGQLGNPLGVDPAPPVADLDGGVPSQVVYPDSTVPLPVIWQ